MTVHTPFHAREQALLIQLPEVGLDADLAVPAHAHGLVVFVHGSGSSRRSGRNRAVAGALQARGLATLLFDLLSEAEDRDPAQRFDIAKLTRRLLDVTQWAWHRRELPALPLAYFGASTGAAAALNAAAELGPDISAVVSRGGRPDLALENLDRVRAPTLLIVGGDDDACIPLNRDAHARLRCKRRLEIVPGASHLFEEPGALDTVARLAGDWLEDHCRTQRPPETPRPWTSDN